MPSVEVVIEGGEWGSDLTTIAERAVAATLAELDLKGAEVSLLACDDARITELNGTFRDKPKPTNVLSWPAQALAAGEGLMPHAPDLEDDPEIGDIALAFETCTAEAKAADKPISDHLTHLIVHGTLHLLGFDHETERDAEIMEGIEVRVLASLGVPDPY